MNEWMNENYMLLSALFMILASIQPQLNHPY